MKTGYLHFELPGMFVGHGEINYGMQLPCNLANEQTCRENFIAFYAQSVYLLRNTPNNIISKYTKLRRYLQHAFVANSLL